MIEFDIIDELGDNAILLLKSDTWLTTVESKLCQDLTNLLHELEQIQTAIRIKHRLQQSNLVAMRRNTYNDEVIEILPLPKAVKLASQTTNYSGQLGVWAADGYCVSEV
jgi:hypothetical protein